MTFNEISARIHKSFAAQSLMQTVEAKISHVVRGKVEIISPLSQLALQQHGLAHAGLTFALGDSAAGYAAMTLLPADQEIVTAEMKINLLAPGQGSSLRAAGRVLKPGKRLIVVAADVYATAQDGTETCIAVMQGTMVPV